MDLNEDDVIQIIRYLDESNFNELQLQLGDLRIVVSRTGSTVPLSGAEHARPPGSMPPPPAPPQLPAHSQPVEQSPPSPTPPTRQPEVQDGANDRGTGITITSPMLGTFYRAPSPGEPPFVEVGSLVDEETTVCIIEVMKLFSTIKAEKRGRITRVSAEDGQLVEYGQVLFHLETEETGD